ncbi:MAG: hypothetical protein IPK87_16495 [Planctomycetes bacterium]|nr:hypothetical protein [Planctomycetota bacterium]
MKWEDHVREQREKEIRSDGRAEMFFGLALAIPAVAIGLLIWHVAAQYWDVVGKVLMIGFWVSVIGCYVFVKLAEKPAVPSNPPNDPKRDNED